jgi:hypothetical protein
MIVYALAAVAMLSLALAYRVMSRSIAAEKQRHEIAMRDFAVIRAREIGELTQFRLSVESMIEHQRILNELAQ